MSKQARGLRNNNPLNIKKSDKVFWLGEVVPGRDETFSQFETMGLGCRAALKLLRAYHDKYGCTTIRQIIRRWAPETENQVEAYIKTVCKLTHQTADTPLPPMKAETRIVWCDLVLAMASVECGLSADDRDTLRFSIEKGWHLLY
ncbi:MAG: structural protein P5 [Prevotella sp.]|nr:structural protein P5 [Prevotella sp.]